MEIKNYLGKFGNSGSIGTEGSAVDGSGGVGRAERTGTAQSDQAVDGGDKVSLSSEGRMYAQTLGAAAAAPDVRAERVESLKGLVQSGAYEVSSKQIASALLTEQMDLGF